MRRTPALVVPILCTALVAGAPYTAQAKSSSHCRRATHHGHHKHATRCSSHGSTTYVSSHAPAAGPTPASSSATSTATGSTTPPATGCGGEALPLKPDGNAWTCTFDDEFDSTTGDSTSLNTSWWTPEVSATSGYTTGQYPYFACYVNSPHNVSVSTGVLHLTVRRESTPVNCGGHPDAYTSGMVTTARRFSQTYGRFEVRAQLPAVTVAGLQETLWLWPVNATLYGSWPGSGEVDFSEFYSQYSNLDVPFIHYDYKTSNTATSTNVTTNHCPISLSQYNDYAVLWQPGSFQITINGASCLTDNYLPSNVSSPAPFNQPFFIGLTQALGVGTNAFSPSTTPLPATTNIDYVRVWR